MKNFFRTIAFALAVIAGSAAFAAETPSFDNVTVTYQSTDFKVDDADGFAVGFSKTLGDTLFVKGDFSRANANFADADVYRLGAGVRVDFANNAAAYGEAYALRANVDYDNLTGLRDLDSWGYGLEGGARVKIAPAFELRGGVATERLTRNSEWTTYGLVGATFNITDSIAIVGDARIHDDANQYNLGLQYQF